MIIDQLVAIPGSTVTENPNPQVRVQHRYPVNSGWHPDELIETEAGRVSVVVWDEPAGRFAPVVGSHFLKN